MPSQVDHVADRGHVELVRLAGLYEFPEFVKQAGMEATLNPGPLAATVYADPVRRQFGCQTPASTWLSALFYQEKKAEFHPKDRARIEERLDRYADYWGIKSAVAAMRRRWEELHKNAEDRLPDSAFAWVWAGEDGVKERRLPLRNAVETKVAAEWLHAHQDKIPFEHRHAIAKKILEKANQFGAGLGKEAEFVERQAGRGVCDPKEVVGLVRGRAHCTKNAQLRAHFLKMAQTLEAAPRQALLPDTMVKLAATIDRLDRDLGLVHRYADGLPRPDEVIFKEVFVKIAEDLASVVATTSGRVYEKSAFRKLAADDLRGLFGDDFVDRVVTPLGDVDPEKMAEEVHALPRPDAELLDGLLSDAGVSPILAKSAGVRQGFSEEELRAWAAAYQTVG